MSDAPATTNAPVVFESVEISRRLDAIWAAWRAGIFTDDERETRSAPLRELLHQAAADEYAAVAAALGGDASLLAVGTWVVVAGELIESAWGNQVRADLLAHDIAIAARVLRTGDTMSGGLVVGADPTQPGGAGVWLHQTGRVIVSSATATGTPTNANLAIRRGGAQWAAGQPYVFFTAGDAQNSMGSITMATTSSVAYNTTSDRRLKTLTRPVDPDQAVATLAAAEPVNFVFTASPEAGEQVGFFAQDLVTIAPEAVTAGHGEPGDDDFVPWMVDLSKLVPTLVGAVQALDRRLRALEEATP